MTSEDLDVIVAPLRAVNCPDCLVQIVRERARVKALESLNNSRTLRLAGSYVITPVLRAVSPVVARTVKSNFFEYFGR